MAYITRLAETRLQSLLQIMGCLVIGGAKATGKTETARRFAQTVVRLDIDESVRQLATASPTTLLSGKTPVLVDEWQEEPYLWNQVRHEVDRRGLPGQFILTGSATPSDEITRHSGAGRMAEYRLRTFSTLETGDGASQISLSNLFAIPSEINGVSESSYEETVRRIIRGGWPQAQKLAAPSAALFMQEYYEQIVKTDLATSAKPQSIARARSLMVMLAHRLGGEANWQAIAGEMLQLHQDDQISRNWVAQATDRLTDLMLLEPLAPFIAKLRSRARFKKRSKVFFVDPALAVAALNPGAGALEKDAQYTGFLFENLVLRDLRVYSSIWGGQVFYYQDDGRFDGQRHREIDCVVVDGRGDWLGIEVKLSTRPEVIDQAARRLLHIAADIDTRVTPGPKALCIVTSHGYAYRRPDGVYVIPYDLLAP